MRKLLRVVLTAVAVTAAVPALFLSATAATNAVATTAEASEITSYGQLVPVDGKKMNVVIRGQGTQTIVLLPGLGTPAPGLDFQPLINELSAKYRVVAIEPFGTGLSEQTESERTAVNITREVHHALQHLGIDRYVLMGHSMAGIYALTYTAAYPEEVLAFVGLDSSVPDQPGWNQPIPTEGMVWMKNLGITRLLSSLGGDPYADGPYDEASKRQMNLLKTRNAAAATMVNEMDNASSNFRAVSGATFPAELPVLLLVRTKNIDVDGWLHLHQQQAASVRNSRLIELDADHYLHHTRSPEIFRETGLFLSELPTDAGGGRVER